MTQHRVMGIDAPVTPATQLDLTVDGAPVRILFAPEPNLEVLKHVKEILLQTAYKKLNI